MREETAGPITLVTVLASDEDAKDPNNVDPWDVITYSITGTTPSNSDFTIDANTGVISYNGAGIDYETDPTVYTLNVMATSGGLSDTVDVIVSVLGNPPPLPKNQIVTFFS